MHPQPCRDCPCEIADTRALMVGLGVAIAAVAGMVALLQRRRQQRRGTVVEEWEQLGFGEACRHHFKLDFHSGYTHLNHGSYGVAPRRVLAALFKEVEAMESFPDGRPPISSPR